MTISKKVINSDSMVLGSESVTHSVHYLFSYLQVVVSQESKSCEEKNLY